MQKKAIRTIFQARNNVHTQKLFQLANIKPIDRIYENEAIKSILPVGLIHTGGTGNLFIIKSSGLEYLELNPNKKQSVSEIFLRIL